MWVLKVYVEGRYIIYKNILIGSQILWFGNFREEKMKAAK